MKNDKRKYKFKSVMLIDDNEIDNFINEKMVKSAYFSENVYVHTSASSALEFLKNISSLSTFPEELIPAYVFLDINMPILDGFHFLDAFQNLPSTFCNKIKIVMLTTSLNPSDLEKTKSYKCVIDYFYKPLITEDLNKLN